MLSYHRSFRIQAAHFNGNGYKYFHGATESARQGKWESAYTQLMNLLPYQHGHDFKIEVDLHGEPRVATENWLIDDVALTEIVMRWDNTNLSVQDEFLSKGLRATTENMAKVLHGKIAANVAPSVSVRVTVHETDNIQATYPVFQGVK